MNRLYFALLLFVSAAVPSFAQNVNIPDANFKAFLLLVADVNADGEIQVAEAQALTTIDQVASSLYVSDFTGLEAFVNLTYLKIGNSSADTLPLTTLTQLTYLEINSTALVDLNLDSQTNLTTLIVLGGDLHSIDVSGLIHLETLNLSGNYLSSLDVSQCPDLKVFNIGANEIPSIQFHPSVNLETLSVAFNPLGDFDISQHTHLKYLDLSNTNRTSVDVSGFPDLQELYLGSNELASLDVTALPHLTRLGAEGNPITTLDLAQNPELVYLSVAATSISTLDLSAQTQLKDFMCMGSSFSSLDLTALTHLNTLSAGGTMTELDLHNNPELEFVSLNNCPNITSLNFSTNASLVSCALSYFPALVQLNLKNGNNPMLSAWDCPSVAYICADEFSIPYIQSDFGLGSMLIYGNSENAVVNSYCSFVPGGNHNTISGIAKFDSGFNGCDAEDNPYPFFKVKIDDGLQQGVAFATAEGTYSFYTAAGDFTLTPLFENPAYFTVSPTTATASFVDSNANQSTQDFCIAPNGVHPDLEISVIPGNPPVPGFDVGYTLVFKNKGNQNLSGTVSLDFDDALLDFITASQTPASNAGGALGWSYANLQPFESRTIGVNFNLNSPMETPAANIGDELAFTAAITPLANDGTPGDNTFVFTSEVVGSFDPNDKQCAEGTVASPSHIGDYLHYVINFENTGNFPAQNVVVSDLVDTAKFDLNTLQIVHSSHDMQTRLTGDHVEFIFEGIALQPEEHGHVAFKIKTKSNLTVGSSVTNKASIFFDYNFPIETNEATTTFQQLSVGEITDNSISVFPNPTSGIVKINADSEIKSASVYDAQGRIVSVVLADSDEAQVDLSALRSGVYFVKIVSAKGTSVQKISKK